MRTILQVGRLWQLEENITLPENVRQAIKYYGDKYGERFTKVHMKPDMAGKIKAKTCHGLRVISDPDITPKHLFFVGGGQ